MRDKTIDLNAEAGSGVRLMRELKFRAWNKKGKRWLGVNLQMSVVDGLLWWQYGYGCEILSAEERENIELVQYTGLKDKNGKEIYEGDIVEFNVVNPVWDDKSECVIEHRPETWRRVIVYKAPHFVMHWYPHKMEVIGNIFENSKLMETES